MNPFTVVESVAVPVHRSNIDTDVLIPISRLVANAPSELGAYLFEPWRYRADGRPDPGFALNEPRYGGAQVLVAGENFGCGSSREHAVWALVAFGIRTVVAPSFGDIFRQNCFQNGVLPVAVSAADVAVLVKELQEGDSPVVRVDLVEQQLTFPSGRLLNFAIDPERREALLHGLDDIGMTLKLVDRIAEFEAGDAQRRPWSYMTTEAL